MKNIHPSLCTIILFSVLLFLNFESLAQINFPEQPNTILSENEAGGCPGATNFMLVSTTSTTASFSWTQAGGDIEGYSVEIYEPGADPEVDMEITSSGLSDFSATLGNLDPGTSYDAYVLTVCNPFGTVSEHVGPVSFNTTTLGVQENTISKIVVFPNPAYNELHILNNERVDWVKIYTTQGQLVMSKLNVLVVDISTLKSGMYFAQMRTSGAVFSSKFIKN